MKSIITILIVFLGAFSILQEKDKDAFSEFQTWKIQYGKHYTETQEVFRFFNYQLNRDIVNKHNSDSTQTYSMKLNQFSDLSKEEFILLYLTAIPTQESVENENNELSEPNLKSVDWRGITKVKDQGVCAGCWAFGAVGAAEGFFYVKQQKSVVLSEQQLIDCDLSSFGCNGGYQNLALKYIANYGLTTAQAYPYTQKQGACKQQGGPYQTNGAQSVSSANFKKYLSEYPLVVLVDANNWQFYNTGVFSNCGKSVNHAVLAVGYDDSDNWFVKNSWGTNWGDNGFITLAPGNTCGVTGYAYRAI